MVEVEVADRQTCIRVKRETVRQVARLILQQHGPPHAQVSIAIVDDPTIHTLNRRYLQHDYPTDVLSFVLEKDERLLEGEVIVSAETAARRAPEYGWEAHNELLLYVAHGVLHLVGFDDQTPQQRLEMQQQQRRALAMLGMEAR